MGISAVPSGPGGETSRTDPAAPRSEESGREAEAAHLAELVPRSSPGHEEAFS
jgi:hypothetical protein